MSLRVDWLLLYFHLSVVSLEEKQRRENSEDRVLPGRTIEEWLSRREKKKAALSAKGYARRSSCMTPSHTRSARLKVILVWIGIQVLHNLCPQRFENWRRGGRGGGGGGPSGKRRASTAPLNSRPSALSAPSPSRRMESPREHRVGLKDFNSAVLSKWILIIYTEWGLVQKADDLKRKKYYFSM